MSASNYRCPELGETSAELSAPLESSLLISVDLEVVTQCPGQISDSSDSALQHRRVRATVPMVYCLIQCQPRPKQMSADSNQPLRAPARAVQDVGV